jgi:hypothetical protein
MSTQDTGQYIPTVRQSGIRLNANEPLVVATGGTVTLPATTTIGGSTVSALGVITSTSANALTAGPAGTTNPSFNVDASTASAATGLNVKSAASGSGVTVSALGGTNENLFLAGKGTGQVSLADPISTHTPTAINSTATATAAQVATGYITSTSGAATTITLPTGTALGTALGAVQGTIHDLYIDNTAGSNTVTIAVAVNGILSAAAAANGASQGLLTVPSGVTGQACFRLMFSSATAYTFTRVA